MQFAKLVSEARRHAGFSKAELARLTGIEVGHVARLESGVSANPTLSVMESIAAAFGLTVPQLLLGKRPKRKGAA